MSSLVKCKVLCFAETEQHLPFEVTIKGPTLLRNLFYYVKI